jgi:hypothetical protein
LVTYIKKNGINVHSPLPLPSVRALHNGLNYKPVPAVVLDIAASFGGTEIYDKLRELGAQVELSSPLQSVAYGQPGISTNERSEAIDHFTEILKESKISIDENQFKHNKEFVQRLQKLMNNEYDLMPALHMACLAGTLDAVRMPMLSGANPSVKSFKGYTAFQYASFHRDETSSTAKAIRKILRTKISNP